MSKIDRYYVDSSGNPEFSNVVVRDRLSPLGKEVYPCDIAITLQTGMFPSRARMIIIADRVCRILNEEL